MIVEPAPGVRHATHLGDALPESLLVAAEVIADQGALPVVQKAPGILAGPVVAEVVDHRPDGLFLPGHEGPQPALAGLPALFGDSQNPDGGFVGVQNALFEQFPAQGIHERLQRHTTLTHPAAQRGTGNRQARPAIDGFLAVQRQVVAILADQHVRQQPRGGDPLVDDARRHRGLFDAFAVRAGPDATLVVLDEEGTRDVTQFLALVIAHVFERAATGAAPVGRIVTDFGVWQPRWQGLPFGLATGLLFFAGCRSGELCLDRGQILVDGLFEQQSLDAGELLALFAEADATQVRQLDLELLVLDRGEADFFVAPSQFPLLLFENLLLLAQIVRLLLQLLHQRGGELTQLLRIHVRDVSGEFCRGSGPVHGAQYAGVGRCLPSGDFPVARGANP